MALPFDVHFRNYSREITRNGSYVGGMIFYAKALIKTYPYILGQDLRSYYHD